MDGWTKVLELAKLARSEGQRRACATRLHKARSLPKEEVKAGSREAVWKKTGPWEILCFKFYKSHSGRRTSRRDRGLDAGHRQIGWVLSGDDPCGLSGGRALGER
jgi:hypothetical protein